MSKNLDTQNIQKIKVSKNLETKIQVFENFETICKQCIGDQIQIENVNGIK